MDTIVLLSGGMDSCVALAHTLDKAKVEREGNLVHALTFNYGQRNHLEILHAKQIWDQAKKWYEGGMGYHVVSSISPGLIPNVGSLTTKEKVKKYHPNDARNRAKDPAFIPYRNALFIVVTAMWARFFNCNKIVTGMGGVFPDGSPNFLMAMQQALFQSDPGVPMTVISTYDGDKIGLVNLARATPGGVHLLSYSMSCYEGEEPPCGKCLACVSRQEAFTSAGLDDPLMRRLEKERKL